MAWKGYASTKKAKVIAREVLSRVRKNIGY